MSARPTTRPYAVRVGISKGRGESAPAKPAVTARRRTHHCPGETAMVRGGGLGLSSRKPSFAVDPNPIGPGVAPLRLGTPSPGYRSRLSPSYGTRLLVPPVTSAARRILPVSAEYDHDEDPA